MPAPWIGVSVPRGLERGTPRCGIPSRDGFRLGKDEVTMRAIHADGVLNGQSERHMERGGLGVAPAPLSADARDVLGDVLDAVHLQADIGARRRLSAPWDLAFEPGESGFWVVVEGRTRVETADGEGEWLEAGDMVAVTRSAPHRLVSGPEQRDGCTIVEGHFDFEHRGFAPLKTALPPALFARAEEGLPQAWLGDVLRLVEREMSDQRPGSRAIINRLGHIIYLNAVREYAAELPRGQ